MSLCNCVVCTLCFQLQLSYNNPQHLCKQCFKTLQQFIEFREKCIAADAEFTDTSMEVQSQNTEIHIPEVNGAQLQICQSCPSHFLLVHFYIFLCITLHIIANFFILLYYQEVIRTVLNEQDRKSVV